MRASIGARTTGRRDGRRGESECVSLPERRELTLALTGVVTIII